MLPSAGQTDTHTHTHTHTHKDCYTNCLIFKRKKQPKQSGRNKKNVKGIEIFTLKCVVQCKYKMARYSVHQKHAIICIKTSVNFVDEIFSL